MTSFDNILLAVDQSPASDRAVQAASDLAVLSGGTVHLLHVREIEVYVGKSGGTVELESDADVADLVAKEAAVLRDKGVKHTIDVRRVHKPDVARTIVERAEALGADVIVMGSRGRSPISGLLLGSTAFKVLHATHRPVLITP